MAVQWTVARAVGIGLIKDHLPFVRTDKGGKHRRTDFAALWEAVLAGLLLAGAATLVVTNVKEVREIYIFAAVLVVQSLPFLAAVAIALVERSRFNDFATWRALEARTPRCCRGVQRPRPNESRWGNSRHRTPRSSWSGSSPRMTAENFDSPRQRGLRQLHPIGRAERDRLVVEIIRGVMQARAVAVADPDEGARPRVQHEGEILRAHHRRQRGVDVAVRPRPAARPTRRSRSARRG